MVPTRTEIQSKIDSLIKDKTKNREDFPGAISDWLTGLGVTAEDKVKILSDLVSYPNY